jgi:hypothetical protein
MVGLALSNLDCRTQSEGTSEVLILDLLSLVCFAGASSINCTFDRTCIQTRTPFCTNRTCSHAQLIALSGLSTDTTVIFIGILTIFVLQREYRGARMGLRSPVDSIVRSVVLRDCYISLVQDSLPPHQALTSTDSAQRCSACRSLVDAPATAGSFVFPFD